MRRIVVDAMGGDHGAEEIIRGAAQASLSLARSEIILVGDAARIGKHLIECRQDGGRVRVHHAGETIHMDEAPLEAITARPDASIIVAADLVAKGEGDALVTAGNVGAGLLACARRWTRLPTVERAAMASVFPTELRRGETNDPFALLLDVGASADASAADLVCFAHMGATYARLISKNERPRVALLSSGNETGKGPPAVVEAHQILSTHSHLNFVGNIQGIDIPRGVADVVVCSGYVGNVVNKMLEGVSETVVNMARYAYKEKLLWRAALKALSSGLERLKDVTDWKPYGGAPLLGFEHLLIQTHAHAKSPAIANAIRLADKCVRLELNGKIQQGLEDFELHRADSD